MANKKLDELTALTTPADGDLLYTEDVSDTTDQPAGTNKKITWTSIKAFLKTYFDTLYSTITNLSDHMSDTSTHGVTTIAGISETQTLTNKTLSTGVKLDSNADQNITQYGMSRQAIMNGNFDVWQRGTSFTPIDSTKVFSSDRFGDTTIKDGGTLPTLTRSRQLLTSGDIANAFYFSRLTTNGAGTSLGVNSVGVLQQNIENGVRNLCGLNKKVTLSFWAKSDIANKRICPAIRLVFGTGGSPSADDIIKGTPITLTSTWTKYTVTFTTSTLVGKTFGTAVDDYISLNMYYMWGTTFGNTYVQTSVTTETFVGAGNIDIAQVQLCSGDVALPFQPKSYGEELRACQRYYEEIELNNGIAVGTSVICPYAGSFMQKKRIGATATVHAYDGTAGAVSLFGSATTAATGCTVELGFTGVRNLISSAAFTPGNTYWYTIKISSEL